MHETLAAIRHLERAVVDAGGLALRYGNLYGSPDDAQIEPVRKRRFPIVGDGGGVWSFVHLDDAAAATALALERGDPGVYNVVDDEPAPVRERLPALAKAVGAAPPRRLPRWLARLVAGKAVEVMMTEIRGASNAKAKQELGWTLRFPSWREGFPAAYGARCTPRRADGVRRSDRRDERGKLSGATLADLIGVPGEPLPSREAGRDRRGDRRPGALAPGPSPPRHHRVRDQRLDGRRRRRPDHQRARRGGRRPGGALRRSARAGRVRARRRAGRRPGRDAGARPARE